MLTEFLEKKLNKARVKLLKDGTYFASIPTLKGVWANAPTLVACRAELREVLEDWVLLKVHAHEPVPGLTFPVRHPVAVYA